MIIPIPVLSAIETALNTWLMLDGESLNKCKTLEGKIIRLHITGLELNLFFFPAMSGIQVSANYPQSEISEVDETSSSSITGEVDATIHGSPMALIRLGTAKNAGASMLESDVVIDGDMRVAEQFSHILKEVDIDWEELLSKLVGDIIAQQTGQVIRTSNDWLSETVNAMKLNTSEYLIEESKLTPADSEINDYMDQVDDLRMNTDRMEARVKNLLSALNKINAKEHEK